MELKRRGRRRRKEVRKRSGLAMRDVGEDGRWVLCVGLGRSSEMGYNI